MKSNVSPIKRVQIVVNFTVMKKSILTSLLSIALLCGYAEHIKGGFFTYQYLGPGSGDNLKYKITLTVYMVCNPSEGQLSDTINFSIYEGVSDNIYRNAKVKTKTKYNLVKTEDELCISGDQRGCYYTIVVYELASIELPANAEGYTVSYQRCCRIANMDNIVNSGEVGNTYSIKIPGTNATVPDANKNNSPNFAVNDLAVICEGSFFSTSLAATDPDGDYLTYSLCGAFGGGTTNNPVPYQADAPGTYPLAPYSNPYSGASPMGSKVSIDPTTGMLSGIAPPIKSTGEYVVTVCVSEYRAGIYLGESRKELHIRVRSCTPLKALLNPKSVTCDGYNVTFFNDVVNESGTEYRWNFGDPRSGPDSISNLEKPAHTFSDTGVYKIKLHVSLAGLCADSTTATIKVYPGFFPEFASAPPYCKGEPVSFRDQTTANYGIVNNWRWDFGDGTSTGDTSKIKAPTYTYNTAGNYTVTLVSGSSLGCTDTISKQITIKETPVLTKPTQFPNDTLICIIDTLQLKTNAPGNFVWSPSYMISNLNTASPLVSPDVPTKYYAFYTDTSGCHTTDSVFVNVKSFVSVNAGKDTTICRTDAITINTISDGLYFSWTPATYLNSDTAMRPIATPLDPQVTYTVTAGIGKCKNTSSITVRTVPYPVADAGPDRAICAGESTSLSASGGNRYSWSPAIYLSNPAISNPQVVKPVNTTTYTVSVTDNKGCPKPATDEVLVTVRYPTAYIPFSDTSLVLGETLQFDVPGAEFYKWTPSQWLSDDTVSNPVTAPLDSIEYRLHTVTKEGCVTDDTVRIKVFKLPPSFYVPTAFSPNNDGLNDVLRPITLGIKSMKYFRVYNRGGQLLFSTTERGKGWDGTYKGNPQDPATYVWTAEGVTYKGENIVRKGAAVLVR